jgi:hypothetical protein
MGSTDRRPRIPRDLAVRIDALRGNTPFEPYVRRLLEAKVSETEKRAAKKGQR